MRYGMLRFLAAAIGLGFTVTAPAMAETAELKGFVVTLSPWYNARQGKTYFTVYDATTLAACTTDGSYTKLHIPDTERGKQMYALVEAALMSGNSLKVKIDSTLAPGGKCWAQQITYIQPGPP